MANKKHLEVIEQGPKAWNQWRKKNPDIIPDLSGADLSGVDFINEEMLRANLRVANLSFANLREADLLGALLSMSHLVGTDLIEADLEMADLNRAVLSTAYFTKANLSGANLSEATLYRAELYGANLYGADLNNADLTEATLNRAILNHALLHQTDLSRAILGETTFAANDLSTVTGLKTITHERPSSIDIDTIFRSEGKIPEVFLRGAGVPEEFITQIPSLIARIQPIQFDSCFISYSNQDEEFSQRLHTQMRNENLRVWYAPEDMKGGRKLHEEIFRAIQIHDKLLLVLSESSMKSEWVMTEIRRARKIEREENRRKLFPIRLVDFEAIQKWECFDADSGKDLAVELREYYIPDFSNWKNHDAFEAEFAKLLRDLRAEQLETRL